MFIFLTWIVTLYTRKEQASEESECDEDGHYFWSVSSSHILCEGGRGDDDTRGRERERERERAMLYICDVSLDVDVDVSFSSLRVTGKRTRRNKAKYYSS